MSRTRVLIVDDHPVFRQGIKDVIETGPEIDVVGQAADGEVAIEHAYDLMPDVILMDLQMPDMDGLTAIQNIRAQQPEARIIVLTTYDTDADIMPALKAGATGYLLKDAPPEALFDSIQSAVRGEVAYAPSVAQKITRHLTSGPKRSLSKREVEVLELASQGNANKAIASKLHITEATVKSHFVHIFAKLGVDDRTSAVTVALKRKIIRLT